MGVVKRVPFQFFTIVACVFLAQPSSSQMAASSLNKGAGIIKILGQAVPKFEALFGPAVDSKRDGNGGTIKHFTLAGSEGVRVYSKTHHSKGATSFVSVSFAKGTNWKQAAEFVGLKPATLKASRTAKVPGLFHLVGDPIKNWNVFFASEGARYPGQGNLINEDRGLPMIQFAPRYDNDDSPD